jgi:hypothetical protein
MDNGDKAPRILTSAVDKDEWSDSRTDRFIPRERALGAHCTSRLGRSQILSGRFGEDKELFTLQESNPNSSVVQHVA